MESDTNSPIFIQRTVILHKKQESCISLIPKEELVRLPSTVLAQLLPLKDPSRALHMGCSPGSLVSAACQAPITHRSAACTSMGYVFHKLPVLPIPLSLPPQRCQLTN